MISLSSTRHGFNLGEETGDMYAEDCPMYQRSRSLHTTPMSHTCQHEDQVQSQHHHQRHFHCHDQIIQHQNHMNKFQFNTDRSYSAGPSDFQPLQETSPEQTPGRRGAHVHVKADSKLFVGGLSYGTTDDSFVRFFTQFGRVDLAEVLRDNYTLRSRGFGFVVFADPNVARNVEAMDPSLHVIDGKNVDVKFATPKPQMQQQNSHQKLSQGVRRLNRSQSHGPYASNNFTAGQLAGGKGFNDVSPMTANGRRNSRNPSQWGMYAQASTTKYQPESLTRRLSGAKYPQEQQQQHCGYSLTPQSQYDDHTDTDTGASEQEEVIVPNKIFVGGLLYATGHESLRRFFETIGEVESAEVIYNRDTKKSRGFGFVIFKEFAAVEEVLHRQDTDCVLIDGKQVEVKLCKAREDTVAELLHSRNKSFSERPRNLAPCSMGQQQSGYDPRSQLCAQVNSNHARGTVPMSSRSSSLYSNIVPATDGPLFGNGYVVPQQRMLRRANTFEASPSSGHSMQSTETDLFGGFLTGDSVGLLSLSDEDVGPNYAPLSPLSRFNQESSILDETACMLKTSPLTGSRQFSSSTNLETPAFYGTIGDGVNNQYKNRNVSDSSFSAELFWETVNDEAKFRNQYNNRTRCDEFTCQEASFMGFPMSNLEPITENDCV